MPPKVAPKPVPEDLTLQLFERIEVQPLTADGWETLLSGWLPKASEPVLKSYAQTLLDHDITTVETLTFLENRDMADLKIAPVHRPLIAAAAADLMAPIDGLTEIQIHNSPAVSRTFGLREVPGGILGELMSKELWQSVAAEFICTLLLLYLTARVMLSSFLTSSPPSSPVLTVPYFQSAVMFGVSYGLLNWLFFPLSGHHQQAPAPHMNPVLTLIAVCTTAISPLRCFMYVSAQLAGSVGGAALARSMDPAAFPSVATPLMYDRHSISFYDIVFGILLALLVLRVRLENIIKHKDRVPYTPQVSISLGLFFFLNASVSRGGLVNPVWYFGLAAVLHDWEEHWVFWVPSLLSSVGGILLHAILTKRIFLRDRRF
eukprot:gb/GEZN01009711.1/.p1 GENE.gb/GEZN01009711.1/~~gb/GEZN01009711.1/.p1  ORF type:complete len:374 (-),score=44.30 gb/GEZN01009711.1/:105-1226(-)